MSEHEIFAIEKGFWSGDGDYYRRHVDDRCLVAFTEMSGVLEREAIAGMIPEGARWQGVEMIARGLVEPAEGVAILTYEVRANRTGKEGTGRHHAVVSSGYVRRGGAWKLVFHQQTPLPAE